MYENWTTEQSIFEIISKQKANDQKEFHKYSLFVQPVWRCYYTLSVGHLNVLKIGLTNTNKIDYASGHLI